MEDYLKAVDALIINQEHRLKKQMQQLQDKHSEEWQALKSEMQQLKQLLDWSKKPKELTEHLMREAAEQIQMEDDQS